ncbi:hypothetical protein BIW11_08025 [Tropilaelaps mercedesae]|uniref:Gustatory receptor n=1 Tax=Tropilaelaps mercedesae TaxID=418985 RepID=A0A1V9XRN6_9ACAR|nr:hypothetical protein BIW11_08025 [Tropilaelaps mercedesae]
MRQSSVATSFVLLSFLVIVNEVDESHGIIIPIIKPDLRFLLEKKKTLLSFLNTQAIFQTLGQLINLNAVLQHFGLVPPPAADAEQKGSGSTNQMTIVSAPETSVEDTMMTGDKAVNFTEADGDTAVNVVTPEREDSIEGIYPQESCKHADVDIGDDAKPTSAAGQSYEAKLSSDELRTNEVNGIEITLRRRKLEGIRRRYLLGGRLGSSTIAKLADGATGVALPSFWIRQRVVRLQKLEKFVLVYLGIYHLFYSNSSMSIFVSRCMLVVNFGAQLVSVMYMAVFVVLDTEKLVAVAYGVKSLGLVIIYVYICNRREAIGHLLCGSSRKRYKMATISLLLFAISSTAITVITSFEAIELASPGLLDIFDRRTLTLVETVYNLCMWPELCFVPTIFVIIINDLSSRIQDFNDEAGVVSSIGEPQLREVQVRYLVLKFLELKKRSTIICQNLQESIFVLVSIVFSSGCGEIVHLAAYLEYRQNCCSWRKSWLSLNYVVYSNMSVIVSAVLFGVLVYTGHRLDSNGRRSRIWLRKLGLELSKESVPGVFTLVHGDDLTFRFAGCLRLNSQFGMSLVSTIATYAVIFFQVKNQVIMADHAWQSVRTNGTEEIMLRLG